MSKTKYYNSWGDKWTTGQKYVKVLTESEQEAFVPVECTIYDECENCPDKCRECNEGCHYKEVKNVIFNPTNFKQICKESNIEWGIHYPEGTDKKIRKNNPTPFTGFMDGYHCRTCKSYVQWNHATCGMKYPEPIPDLHEESLIVKDGHFTYQEMGGYYSSTDSYAAADTAIRLDVILMKQDGKDHIFPYYVRCILESDIAFASNVSHEFRETDIRFYYAKELRYFLSKWDKLRNSVLFIDRIIGPHHEA